MSLKEKLTNLIEYSTAHGLPNLIRSKYPLVKVLWFLSLALSTSTCVYFIYNTLFSYFAHEFVTKVIEVDDSSPDFPAVSFCINSTNQSIEDVLIYSEFEKDNYKCNNSDFVTIHTHYESCFRFNIFTPIREALIPDIAGGLFVFIHTSSFYFQYLKVSLIIQNSSNLFARFKAYTKEAGELLPAGMSAVKITREFVQNLPAPFNDCVKQDTDEYVSELFQYFVRNNLIYTQTDCTDVCVEEILYEKCNCSVELGQMAKCRQINPKCLETYSKESYKIKFTEKCLKKCPLECDSMNYVINSNFIGVPNKNFLNNYFTDDELNSRDLQNEVVGIYVYYADLNYKLISQIPKITFVDLVSNIGGTLGLFLGVSFLSFVELVEALIESFIHLRKSIKLKSISCVN